MNKPVREGFVEDKPVVVDVPAEEEPASPPPPEEQWPLVIELRHKPIKKSRTESLKELSFREPTARDLIRCGGNPCRLEMIDFDAVSRRVTWRVIIDDNRMMRLMANLSGLLDPQIQEMDPRDYATCVQQLQYFFLPDQL